MNLPEWFQYMTTRNVWLFAHMLGGGLAGGLGDLLDLAKWLTLLIVFAAAVLWELSELALNDSNIINTYGPINSMRHFFFDSLGDILGAVICCALVIYL